MSKSVKLVCFRMAGVWEELGYGWEGAQEVPENKTHNLCVLSGFLASLDDSIGIREEAARICQDSMALLMEMEVVEEI